MTVLSAERPGLTTDRPSRIGVWAGDPLTLSALLAATRELPGVHATNSELQACDVLLIAEDEDGSQARFAAARATADRKFPIVWIRGSGGRELPRADLVVEVLERSEVGTAEFSRAVDRAAQRSRENLGQLTGGDTSPTSPRTENPGTNQHGDPLRELTDRDLEVLRLLAAGESTAGIADRLFYSDRTVTNVIHRLVQRIGARNRSQAVALVVRAGLA